MGFARTFGRKMNKRCFQYAVRSTYPLLESDKDNYGYSPKRETEVPVDKNGVSYCGQCYVTFKGETHMIDEVKGKMVTFMDGTRHRLSSCEF